MAAETGFKINDVIHEVPALDSLTMDEAQILYDYSGLTIEDFVPEEGEEIADSAELDAKLKNPGFMRALMHIAYQRANPKLAPQKVKSLIGNANLIEAMETLADEEAADVGPPASTTEPAESSPNGSVGSSASSGDASRESLDAQVVPLTPTTTSESDTSSTSAQASSVA